MSNEIKLSALFIFVKNIDKNKPYVIFNSTMKNQDLQFLPTDKHSVQNTKTKAIRDAVATLPKSGQSKKFECTRYTAPYLFSTENLVGTYENVTPNGKNILTIGASGDHAFDAYLNGARHVDTFDFNLLQECVINLKTEMIHLMTYKEFKAFFGALHIGKLYASYNILSPHMPHLSPESQTFMEEFYSNPSVNPKYFFQGVPFYEPGLNNMPPPYRKNGIKYMQSEADFNLLKKRLPDKIAFTLADAKTMAQTIHDNYDIIHMSNIIDYVPELQLPHGHIKFCNDTLVPLFNHLKPGGQMIVLYSWGGPKHSLIEKIICDNITPLAYQCQQVYAIQIPSVQKRFNNDTIWIFQKTR